MNIIRVYNADDAVIGKIRVCVCARMYRGVPRVISNGKAGPIRTQDTVNWIGCKSKTILLDVDVRCKLRKL